MENKYREKDGNITFIKYYLVFCTRYKRKIFNIKGVEERTIELIRNECDLLDVNIINVKCNLNHVHLIVETPPNISPNEILQKIKFRTSKQIREEFEELGKIPSLWTRKIFVSTDINNCNEEIKKFIDCQKTK